MENVHNINQNVFYNFARNIEIGFVLQKDTTLVKLGKYQNVIFLNEIPNKFHKKKGLHILKATSLTCPGC